MPKTLTDRQQLESLVAPYGQTHLLRFWDEIDTAGRETLSKQIQQIDFEQVARLHRDESHTSQWEELAARAEMPDAITLNDLQQSDSFMRAKQLGEDRLRSGKVAMILTAGGQGSRLGFDHPKGMFPIGPLSERSLFQIIIEHVLARAKQFKTRIPLYVMTSPPTHAESEAYLRQNNFFGYDSDDVRVFCQGVMPAVDRSGRLLLADKGCVFVSPDGHGGTLAALAKDGCLAELRDRGIEHVFYGQVDNPLIQACHPSLIGYHVDRGSEMTTQVVRKSDPLQKVGNVVSVDGQVRIIEYSDLPETYARQTNADGTLKLWAGNIAVHIFTADFLHRASGDSEALPFHRANKKVPYVNEFGQLVHPDENNATKFERFIFDLLPQAKNAIVCEVDPGDGFCAVKNAPPADSETPQHAKEAIVALHSKWLKSAGVEVKEGTPVEISPFYAVDAEQLAQRPDLPTTIDEPTYLV